MSRSTLLRLAVATTASALALLLAGCGADVPDASPTPSPSDRDTTAPAKSLTREEALQEAMSVLAQYDAIADQVTSDYSVDPSLLSPYATEERIDQLRAFQDRIEASNRRLVGATSYSNEQIQDLDPVSGNVTILICADSSEVRVIDSAGADVTPGDRTDLYSLQVSFARINSLLKVKEDVVWDGATVC